MCLADILTDDSSVEAARAEAAAVVAQITSPHHTSTQHLASFLESMHDIVTALISESGEEEGASRPDIETSDVIPAAKGGAAVIW